MKTNSDYLKDLELAIQCVLGPKTVTAESLLRRDLGIQSLDLIEIMFELKRLTGRDAWSAALQAATRHGWNSDFSAGELVEILSTSAT